MLSHFVNAWVSSVDSKLHGCFHDGAHFGFDSFQRGRIRVISFDQPFRQNQDRIAFRLPEMLFLLRAVILAIDVTYVMSAVTVSIALQKCRSAARTGTSYQPRRDFVHNPDILSVHSDRLNSESRGSAKNRAYSRFLEVRVLVVLIVFTNVDNGQRP